MSTSASRDRIIARLTEDLIGPSSATEILSDRPTQRYSTGILYPRDSELLPEENDEGGNLVNEDEDSASTPDEGGVSLHANMKPSVAGLSFAVKPQDKSITPIIHVEIRCATYKQIAVDDMGEVVTGKPSDRAHERWRRTPLNVVLPVELRLGETRLDLSEHGAAGMELYVLVAPYSGLLTATTALSNRKKRGESRVFDEEQHFFQVELAITSISKGGFALLPSRKAYTDEDSRVAALIYRDVKEYVVGHTCSARIVFRDKNDVDQLKTDWIPAVPVFGISDRGDDVFDKLRNKGAHNPLEARWLAQASEADLVTGLMQLVEVYREWISRENQRIQNLPVDLRPQAKKHMELCTEGANRMEEGVHTIRDNKEVRLAFQLAQKAMDLQFGWSRSSAALSWRPFQLAFQLLVLASLSTRTHNHRNTMDLLWFPTGGGKTEAYLALTAFVIFLRRLRKSKVDDGSGVAVLMRYTLRLLTIQQFQRAAAIIFACELIRRKAESGENKGLDLGKVPFGIGLWVGRKATPLTLKEAINQRPGDPSTPKQLTNCPVCGAPLDWRFSSKESVVKCTGDSAQCELVRTGPQLPIWTIGEEIYRRAPSLLIGTIDKFAQIVRNTDTQIIFGRGVSRWPPDLIIQDELHLISGPLGSIAGLYEVAIDELCRRDAVRPKVIGSTATIRRAVDQTRALFDRDTYQFPSPGIDASNSGFAVEDTNQPGRMYLGITTAGRSATYMLQAIAASLLQAANEPNMPDLDRDYYWTLVTYFNSLRELGRGLVLMQDDVPISVGQFAARRGEKSRKVDPPAELTSRVPAYEIRDMLNRLNMHAGDANVVDLLLASNMISVGMDIPRLGIMLMNAQPKSLSEYIQATSRVGRGMVPGLIVTMYNSTRARDRSHYETFETWHRCLYRDVEASSVTPFASRAQDKALHAILVALVRHTIPQMKNNPILDDVRRSDVERLAAIIEQRVARVDSPERAAVSQKLQRLIDQWASRRDLQSYWDDYGRKISLLMSAEQFAAKADVDPDLDSEGARRAMWPTPNSMREVEAGTPFVLRNVLRAEET